MYFVNLSLKLMLTATIILAWGGSSRLVLGTSSQGHFPNSFPKSYEREYTTRLSTVTAYNTIQSQTDGDECISASSINICGKTNISACPRDLPLFTTISIDGVTYQCLDRLHYRKINQFDISFDKDYQGAINYGRQIKEVKIYK